MTTENRIEWWSVSPHPYTTRCDEMIVREYREVLEGLEHGVEHFLEDADDETMADGVQLPYVVKRFTGTQDEFDAIELVDWR